MTTGRRTFGALCVAVAAAGPVFGQTEALKQVGSFHVAADTAELRGNYAFVAGGHTLTVLDLSDPSSPKKAGEYAFPEQIWSFRLAGTSLSGLAERFFLLVSKNRVSLALLVGHHGCKDGTCAFGGDH